MIVFIRENDGLFVGLFDLFIDIYVDGGWLEWFRWLVCISMCGGGFIYFKWFCNSCFFLYEGKNCGGKSFKV